MKLEGATVAEFTIAGVVYGVVLLWWLEAWVAFELVALAHGVVYAARRN
jgi:hypothetical protein